MMNLPMTILSVGIGLGYADAGQLIMQLKTIRVLELLEEQLYLRLQIILLRKKLQKMLLIIKT